MLINNQELHLLARQIVDESTIGVDTLEKQKFHQKLLKEYTDVEKQKTGHYTQDWSAYNKAQSTEKLALMQILDELLSYIPFEERKGVGRPSVTFRDKIFYILLQCYNTKSSRRCISDLEIARRMNYISNTPHFNSVLKSLNDQSVTKFLKHLVQVSGLPLQNVENDFAVDSSGFSTSQFGRWFDVRTGSPSERRRYLKVHLTCGVRTNIITAVNITEGTRSDFPEFEGLVKTTNQMYKINEVSADKGYSSKHNLEVVNDIGAIPFIPFKGNVTGEMGGSMIWRKMYLFFINYQKEFYHHYHKRSNVETTFHMIKRKFGSHLRSKHATGQANEILAKCLCHNLCVLIQEANELGIELDFKKCANYEIAHK